MNEQFPIVKSLGNLYDALYIENRLHNARFSAKNTLSPKNYFVF
ncbi:hypothetical protein MCEGE14_02389 [Burkholderiaceae bacterium]